VTDAALVARLKQGEVQAFQAVVRDFQPRLYAFLLRLTGRPAIAAELLQETWLSLAAEAPWLRDDTTLAAWLFTVARNHHLSHRRWSVLDGTRLAELLGREEGRRDEHTPESAAIAGQAQARLEAAIAKLPLKYREAVLLVAVEQFEPSEAARILGITPEAFRQRLSRGRAELRPLLDEDAS